MLCQLREPKNRRGTEVGKEQSETGDLERMAPDLLLEGLVDESG